MHAVRELPRRPVSPLDERRRMVREAVSAKGLISMPGYDDDGEGQLVEVFDLHLQGCGFRSPVELEKGCYHQILVMAGPLRLSSRLRVVSIRPFADGGFEVGAEFC
jgi:hypothetical protein